jgi:hypothetical protein
MRAGILAGVTDTTATLAIGAGGVTATAGERTAAAQAL